MNTFMSMDPLGLFDELFDMNSRALNRMRARAAGRFPPVNVLLDDNAAIVDIELPGRSAKDVSLTLEPQAVVIADNPEKPAEGDARPAWSRRVELPFRVDADKASAKFVNGILRIELPKSEADGVRRIAIQG